MFTKLLRLLAILCLAVVFGTAVSYLVGKPERSEVRAPGSVTQTSAVKVTQPVDLVGTWKSDKPKVVATVLNGTIEVESTTEVGGYVRWWYGTFQNPPVGQYGVTSKGVDDADKFYLSSAETKDFVYDPKDKILRFQISVMGVTTVVEMKRV